MWREGEGKPMPATNGRFFHRFEADLQHLLAKRTTKVSSNEAAGFRAKKAARSAYQSEGRNLGRVSSGLQRDDGFTLERRHRGQCRSLSFKQHPPFESA